MRRAIGKHLGDVVAMLALVVLAAGVGGYILSNQRLRFPFIGDKPYVVKVALSDAQAVQPGQGQTVRVAGVEIGQIGDVNLKDGKAVVTMDLQSKYKGYIRQDATALLRSKTGLKDMFIEVTPGTGKPIPEGGTIPANNTAPDVDPDEFLAALDGDTRDYLKLLINGAGEGLKGNGSDLQETFARLGPTNRDLARVTSAVARRKRNLSHLIHEYGLLTKELSTKDKDIVRLVRQGNTVLDSFAREDTNISAAVSKLPSTLNTTRDTLAKVDTLGQHLGPALDAVRPAFEQLDDTNKKVLPLVKEATPEIRDQIRPFARTAPGFTSNLGDAARNVNVALPDLTSTTLELNRFFNIGAYNPGGAEGLTGNPQVDRDRKEGYLYWLGWTAQNTVSLFSTADASGPIRRITLGGAGLNCSVLQGFGIPAPVVKTLGQAGVCPATGGGL